MAADDLPWCSPRLRHVFEAARLNERCKAEHAPRLAHIGGDAWVCACPHGPGRCDGFASLLLRVGRWHDERAGHVERVRRSSERSIVNTIGAAVPLPIDPAALCRGDDLRLARVLGVDRWGVALVGKTPALVGFAGEFTRRKARAIVAPNAEPAKRYRAELRAFVGRP